MSLLIGKHFLGTDRPAIESNDTGSYTQAGGTLTKNGVSHDDIDQGAVGTCYLLSALAWNGQRQTQRDQQHVPRQW